MILNPSYTEENLSYFLRSFTGLYLKISVETFFLTYKFFIVNVNICPYILSGFEDQVVRMLIYMRCR